MIRFSQLFEDKEAFKNAIRAYVGADSGGPNNELRANAGKPTNPSTGHWVNRIDSGMKASKGERTLRRGIKHDSVPHDVKPGDVIHDHGYMSTSTGGSYHGFAEVGGKNINGVRHTTSLKIKAPAGTRLLNPKAVLGDKGHHNVGEDERILARGTHIRVDKVKHSASEDGKRVSREIHGTIVHQDEHDA